MRTRLHRTIGTLICALCTGTAALGQPTLPKIEFRRLRQHGLYIAERC